MSIRIRLFFDSVKMHSDLARPSGRRQGCDVSGPGACDHQRRKRPSPLRRAERRSPSTEVRARKIWPQKRERTGFATLHRALGRRRRCDPESQASHVGIASPPDREPGVAMKWRRRLNAPRSRRGREGLTESQRHKSREIPCELSRQNQKYVLCIPTVGIYSRPRKTGGKTSNRGCLKHWPTTCRASRRGEAISLTTSPTTH